MKRTPWVFMWVKLGVLIIIAFATYVSKDGSQDLPDSIVWFGDLVAKRPNLWILVAAAVGALLELGERVVTPLQFRKETIQGLLDQVVRDLFHNKPRDNRCTLFRAARGYIVMPIVLWRALVWQEGKLRHMRSAFLNPLGTYLYVWARAKGSRNHRSCVAFRVHNTSARTSEGIAGRVWEKDSFEAHELPALEPKDLEGLRSLAELPSDHPVARYARAGNVSKLHHLRARDRFARHFYGSVLESPKSGAKWGILLIDSVEKTCPWPARNRGRAAAQLKDFERDFERFTLMLSTILS